MSSENSLEVSGEVQSFSNDGYELLHDEVMDQISVSIQDSNFGESNSKLSLKLPDFDNDESKKMKISLSQEQLKLNGNKNFLTVPVCVKKQRSASFSSVDARNARRTVKIFTATDLMNKLESAHTTSSPGHIRVGDLNEIIYATPQKQFSHSTTSPHCSLSGIKTSSASSSITATVAESSKSVANVPSTSSLSEMNFKYPLAYYCKFCNKLLDDPRVLDCLHTFCCQCLAQLDASSNLQNNQFWRKISDASSVQEPSMLSRSSADSDAIHQNNNKLSTPEKKAFLSGSAKSPRKFSLRNAFKDKSPTRAVKGRNSSIISFTDKPKSIICPTCGMTTDMTIHGVFRLPQHTLMARKIKDALGNSDREQINSCQLCTVSNSVATSICMTCSFKLCSTCKDIHKRHTSNHEIKKFQEKKARKSSDKSPSRDTSIKCLIHSSNDLKLFCTTCCHVICSECTILIHRGHKMTSIAKASKIYIEMLKDAKDNTKPLTTYAMHSIAKLNEASKKINQKCNAVEQEVEVHLAEYFEALEVHKRTLLNQIARCRETKMDVLQSQQIDLERRTSEAKAAMNFTEMLLREGTEVEGLMFVNTLLKRFDACRSSERLLDIKINDTLQFLPEVQAPSNKAQNHIPLFGIITTQIAVAKNCTLESHAGLMNLRVLKKAELLLQTRDNEERPMCHGCAVVEVTVLYRDVTFKTLPVHISDKRDGTYTIAFIPDTPGLIQITIMVNGKPIKNSPFLVRARNLRPHSGIFHCCSFCSSNGKKVCACGGAMEIDGVLRYGSCGHGHDFHPGRRHWSCCASLLENSECSVANAINLENLNEN